MQLACSALAPLSNKFSYKPGSFSSLCNPYSTLQLKVLSLYIHSQPAPSCPHSLPPWLRSSLLTQLPISAPPTGLGECFFNSLVFRVPCSLLFWQFWLFIVLKLVIILLLVLQEVKCFYVQLHLGWNPCSRDYNIYI